MRIPNLTANTQLSELIQNNRSRLQDVQLRIADGRQYRTRSEATRSSSEAAAMQRRLDANAQWRRNVEQANHWEALSEAGLNGTVDVMQRLSELVIEANNGTITDEQRSQLASEADGLLEELYRLSNTRSGHSYLYGSESTTAPFVATRADGKITSVAYDGGENTRILHVGADVSIPYGTVGGGTDGLFVASDENVDIFAHVIALRDELSAGNMVDESLHGQLQKGLDHSIGKLVNSGVRQQRLNHLSTFLEQQSVSEHEQLAQVRDLDLASAASELSQMEAAYEASLQMVARMNRLSLMDFVS